MLSFDNVELYYDHVYALKGVSIELMEGETVALIGANGAGKSSILRAITGLRKIKSGSISYLGDRIDGRPAAEIVKRGIAMVPEGRRVFPLMSVKDNLLMGAFTRTDKQGIEQTLESVLTRFPAPEGTLRPAGQHPVGRRAADDGDRPRADGKAEAVLLDEPSLGIAPKLVQDIARAIVAISRDEGRVGAAGRTEQPHGAVDLEPRLCDVDRAGRAVGSVEGPDARRPDQGRLPWWRPLTCAFW